MRRVGQARRRDTGERAIISALEAVGIVVFPISGAGCPDLLLYCPQTRVWLPVEVKGPQGRLTAAQCQQRALAPYPVVRSVGDALTLVGVVGVKKW